MSMLQEMDRVRVERKLTDSQFAALLGITREYWNYIKNKKMPLSAKVGKRTIEVFPELQDVFLSTNFTKSNGGDTNK